MAFEFQHEVDNRVLTEPSPTMDFIAGFLQQMNPQTCSFCVLAFAGHTYMKCAGGKDRLTVEYRVEDGDGFRHFVIGRRSTTAFPVKVKYSGGEIKIRTNELFTWENALDMFGEFMSRQQAGESYIVRETTDMFT